MHPEFRKIRTPYRKQSQPPGNPSVFFNLPMFLKFEYVPSRSLFLFRSFGIFWLFSVLKVVLKRSTYSNFFYICIWKIFCYYFFYYFQIFFIIFRIIFVISLFFFKHLFSYFLICLWNFHNFQNHFRNFAIF